MSQINELGLRWFQHHAGRTVTWQDLQNGPCLLVTSAKGIFKPKEQRYALSVRQTLDSPYRDVEPIYQGDGS
jgi:putative restriction endonuclease